MFIFRGQTSFAFKGSNPTANTIASNILMHHVKKSGKGDSNYSFKLLEVTDLIARSVFSCQLQEGYKCKGF